jgi:DNA-binding CsgD family transcriptional regulator
MARAKSRKGTPSPALARELKAFGALGVAFAELAHEVEAEEYAIFTFGPSLGQGRLVPAIDSDFPKTSRLSKRLAEEAHAGLGERLRSSSRPFRWRRAGRSASNELYLADEADPLGHVGSGFALPLHTASGRNGLAVFFGETPGLSDEMLVEFHLRCVQLFSALIEVTTASARRLPAMSNRELDCLRLTADGKTSEEIAELLHLSAHTANQYLTTAALKLDAVNRTHAVSKALRMGLIS